MKFFIVRRKIYEDAAFPRKRVQEYVPTQGKRKVEEAYIRLSDFVRNVFTTDAKYIDKEYPKNNKSCKYCPFADKPELCNKK